MSEEFVKKFLVHIGIGKVPSKLWMVFLVESGFHQMGGPGPGILRTVVLHQNHWGNYFPNKHARISPQPSESESLGDGAHVYVL